MWREVAVATEGAGALPETRGLEGWRPQQHRQHACMPACSATSASAALPDRARPCSTAHLHAQAADAAVGRGGQQQQRAAADVSHLDCRHAAAVRKRGQPLHGRVRRDLVARVLHRQVDHREAGLLPRERRQAGRQG